MEGTDTAQAVSLFAVMALSLGVSKLSVQQSPGVCVQRDCWAHSQVFLVPWVWGRA